MATCRQRTTEMTNFKPVTTFTPVPWLNPTHIKSGVLYGAPMPQYLPVPTLLNEKGVNLTSEIAEEHFWHTEKERKGMWGGLTWPTLKGHLQHFSFAEYVEHYYDWPYAVLPDGFELTARVYHTFKEFGGWRENRNYLLRVRVPRFIPEGDGVRVTTTTSNYKYS